MNRFAPSLTDAQFAALPLSERFVLVAAYYCDKVKVHEQPKGSNRGPEIDQWANEFHTPYASPWCGLFVAHCLRAAGYRGPLPQNPASTHAWAQWAKTTHRNVAIPKRGDIFVLLFTPTTGHMGAIVGVDDAPTYRTIEGNSNDDGGREGYEVVRHARKLASSPNTILVRVTE